VDAGRPLADWRSAAPYEPLAKCGRHGFAWEWLRRSAAYRRAAESADNGTEGLSCFGLYRFEPAGLRALDARPIWRGDADPHVLRAVAAPARDPCDVFDFATLGSLGSYAIGSDGIEHWLWSDGVRQIRLDVVGHSLTQGPVRLHYRIAGFAGAMAPTTTLARLVALIRTGRLIPGLFAAENKATRWALVLRTHDALAAGATQRELAEQFFDIGGVPRWRITAASDRERVRRLVTAARTAAQVDPRHWLDGRFP